MNDLKAMNEIRGKEMERLLGMDEAAAFLGLKKATLYKYVMHKRIVHIKLGSLTKFTFNMLLDFAQANTVEPMQEATQNA